ncbi:MAG: efflux RND transporter permease subunit [Phycisphaeraceae bacterium]|nr:efflux RND transporter permease subunit [Phycisphaeraceae bacterium]
MQRLAEICIRRPIFASMIILALVVVGVTSYMRLGVDRLPSVDLPTVSIRTTLAGASPEEMESEVTKVIEEVVNTVEGIDELRSISGAGASVVIATFKLNRNIDSAAQDVRDRVQTALRRLPDDADPPVVSKVDNDSTPVLSIAVSGERTIRELTEIADKIVKVRLERSTGVGQINLSGGLERTINIWVNADRLAAHRLPITAVRDAIARENADVPGGNVTGSDREQILRTTAKLKDAAAFERVVIANINGAPLRVSDIGRAEDGNREPRSFARLNGKPAVVLDVVRQSGANTVEVIEGIKEKLPQVLDEVPPGVRVEVIRDQSRYIYAALHEIDTHLILGSVLACLVVLAFMRSWRSTIIASVAIPASVISTFGMMWALGFTLNAVTMLALVLMVGIVIDDAIVVLENIYRFVEEKKMNPMDAAREATAEIGLAVLATTLSLVVIFVPVSFMSSISGRFLYQFGITAAVAVLVSLLVSFTLTPMMSARLLRTNDSSHGGHAAAEAKSRGGFYGVIDRGYTALLKLAMRFRIPVAFVGLLVILSAIPLYRAVRQEYTPSDVDEAEFSLNVTAREGTSLSAMDGAMKAIEDDVRQIVVNGQKPVQVMLTTIGGGFLGQVNQGSAYIRIAPHEQRIFSLGRLWRELIHGRPRQAFAGNYSQRDVMLAIRKKLAQYSDLRTSVRNYPSFNIGGGNFDIDFAIRGPELSVLAAKAEELRIKSKDLGGIVDADTTLKLDKPELHVELDRERAADLHINARDLGATLRLMVGGAEEISRFRDESLNEDYDVQLRLSEDFRNKASSLSQLYVPRNDGGVIELANVASIRDTGSASRIDRLDRQRVVNLRASIGPGYALADRLEALRHASTELGLPQGYTTVVVGRGRELERTFTEFLWAFLLSIIFMYMILAAQYESLIHPLTILLSLPLSVPFALLSLYLTGGTLNLYSALGILVLFGVVKKNSILQIDHMNKLRADGMPRYEAIIRGNRDRLRPILMTTLALVAGMLPLWIGTGPGAEERRAVAVVVIGGQTLSLLLTLIVTPVAYSLFDDLRFASRREKPAPLPAEIAAGK